MQEESAPRTPQPTTIKTLGVDTASKVVTASTVRAIIADQFRKLKSDATKAQRDADHHRLLAHTVSKSYALAIVEIEQLRELAREAQHSAQVSQQQSRHDQAEAHRLRKQVEQALQLRGSVQPAVSIQDSKQASGHVPEAAEPEAQELQQTSNSCLQQAAEAAHRPQLHDDTTQSEAGVTQLPCDTHQAASDLKQEVMDMVQPSDHDRDVQVAMGLQHRIASLQVQLDVVTSGVLAMQQAAQHDQCCKHAPLPVDRMLLQMEAMLQSMSMLYKQMKKVVCSLPETKQHAVSVSQGVRNSVQLHIKHTDQGAADKRQQCDDCAPCGKRQKLQPHADG